MRLILREAVNNLGAAGEVVRVKPGYGRNFLIPQGLAYIATDSNMRRMEEERQLLDEKAKHDFLEAKRRASQLEGVALSFVVQAGEEGKLFGSVTAKDIGDEVQTKGLDFDLDRRSVALPEPIKSLGDYTVPIKLHPDVQVDIQVAVTADES